MLIRSNCVISARVRSPLTRLIQNTHTAILVLCVRFHNFFSSHPSYHGAAAVVAVHQSKAKCDGQVENDLCCGPCATVIFSRQVMDEKRMRKRVKIEFGRFESIVAPWNRSCRGAR